jgi:hypothetical protein
MLNCDKCGYANELGRIFCHQCGAKLDLSSVKPPSQGGKRFASKKKSKHRGGLGGLLLAVGVIGLTVWMGYQASLMPELPLLNLPPEVMRASKKKFSMMDQQTLKKQAFDTRINEDELNAYFKSMITDGTTATGVRYEFREIRFEVGQADVSVILLGDLRIGESWKHPMYMRLTGVPRIEGGEFTFEPVGGAVGKLPLHPLVVRKTPLPSRFYVNMLSNLSIEKALLNRLTSVEVRDSVIEAKYKP